MQICPLLFVWKPPQWAVGRGVGWQEGRKKRHLWQHWEKKRLCTGKLIPLLNTLVSVMMGKHGATGAGVDEMPVVFWCG